MKSLIIIVCASCVLGLSVPAALAQKVGSTSMQFLHVMPVARATAMGDAYTVWASGADAVYWNPAGVALIDGQGFSSTYIKWIFDTRQGALSYATPIGSIGSFGAQIQYIDYGEFEETSLQRPYIQNPDEPGMTGNTFHPFAYVVGLTYARSLTDKFSTGITVKYVHESLFDGQAISTAVDAAGTTETVNTWGSGVLFDFGIHYNTNFRTIQLGASVQNFGSDIKYGKESNAVPLLFRLGIAADLIGRDALLAQQSDNRVSVALELFQPNDYAQQQHIGLEYEFMGTFALRAGYKFNYDSEGLTVGGGIKQTISSVKLALDYSYGSLGAYLGNAQRISLGAQLP